MNLELMLLAGLLACLGALLGWARYRDAQALRQAADNPSAQDTTGTAREHLLAQAFPQGVPTGLRERLDALGFAFEHSGGFVPNAHPEQVQALVTRLFAPEQQAHAWAALEGYGPNRPHPQRVRLVALYLSQGDLAALRVAIAQGCADAPGLCRQAVELGAAPSSLASDVASPSARALRRWGLWLLHLG